MKRTRTEKGITLVALIITIIVLLILAVVAINAVQNDGIIEYAKNARGDYQSVQAEEQVKLGNYTNYLKENVGTVEIIEFKIEDDPNTYNAEKGMTWEEWAGNTKYNTLGCKIKDNCVYSSDEANTLRKWVEGGTDTIFKNEEIVENEEYTWMTWNMDDWDFAE